MPDCFPDFRKFRFQRRVHNPQDAEILESTVRKLGHLGPEKVVMTEGVFRWRNL